MLIFKFSDGSVTPIKPGTAIADGVVYLTLEQAAEKTGMDTERLRKRWMDAFETFLPSTNIAGSPTPEDASRSPEEVLQWESLPIKEQYELIRETMYPQLTPREFQAFRGICESRHFSIHCRHLYPEIRDGKLTIITSIGALILIALRTGKYQGPLETQWSGADEVFKDVWNGVDPPKWARVGIMREGFTQPVFGKAEWAAYAPYADVNGMQCLDPFWSKHATGQLAKCAMALGLRSAFPEEMAGIYCREEMAQAGPPSKPRGGLPPGSPLRIAAESPVEDIQPASELEPIEQEEFEDLLYQAYPDPGLRSASMANFRGRYPQLWRNDKNGFHRRIAADLREIIRRRESA